LSGCCDRKVERIGFLLATAGKERPMTIKAILKNKGNSVITIGTFCLVRDAMQTMVDCKVAALVLINGAEVIGVVSERDILRAVSDGGATILDAPIGNIVTSGLVAVSPEEGLKQVMQLMTHRRIRHLPVMEDRQLVGIVSLGDIVKYRLEDLEMESSVLRDLAVAVR
jgi:CBS domain-containing protein